MTKTSGLISTIILACAGVLTISCKPITPKLRDQSAVVALESDPGVPLAGGVVYVGERPVTRTEADGRAKVSLSGLEGDVFRLSVSCPEGHRAPAAIEFDLLVQKNADGSLPELRARCPRTLRRAVVVMRAENGKDLPVVHLGRVVARTDASGAATFGLDVHPSEDVELTFDTTAAKKLVPHMPIVSFKAPERDDIVFVEQKFTVEAAAKKRAVVRASSVPRKLGET